MIIPEIREFSKNVIYAQLLAADIKNKIANVNCANHNYRYSKVLIDTIKKDGQDYTCVVKIETYHCEECKDRILRALKTNGIPHIEL